jgi:hypothetical protein
VFLACYTNGGMRVYCARSDREQFFAQAGFPCPPMRNPSDHFLRCINSDFDRVKATLKGSMKTRVSRILPPPILLLQYSLL